jgi:nucleoporin POM152
VPLGLGYLVTPFGLGGRDAHLLGEHTVRLSPISTAQLNPDHSTFCLGPSGSFVLVPLLLNNTDVSHIKYSLTPLGYRHDLEEYEKSNKVVGKVEHHELHRRELRMLQQTYEDVSKAARITPLVPQESDEYDEYDDDDEGEQLDRKNTIQSTLQKTQSLQYIRLNKPGTLHLEHVIDMSNLEARIVYSTDVTVVPCPRVEFLEDSVTSPGGDVRCRGQSPDIDLTISIYGVPPLTLRWYKDINGRKERFLVEGIEGEHQDGPSPHETGTVRESVHRRHVPVPQDLKVPLSVPLDSLGTHLYALEEVLDAFGNLVRVTEPPSPEQQTSTNTKTTRMLTVLQRPSFSFQGCGPGNPTPLLIGSEAPLTVSANTADPLDGPWELSMKYVPPATTDEGAKGATKRFKPWQRKSKTQPPKQDLVVRANAPGEYTILSVKGKVYLDIESFVLTVLRVVLVV